MSKKTVVRRKVQPIVAAVVRPVARRLARIEDLLVEIRHELDVQLKRTAGIQGRLDSLIEEVATIRVRK